MAGGLGTKLFLQGDTLSADDVNGYFMNQSVMRFATTTARDAAFGDGVPVSLGGDGKPLLQEGMVAYIDNLDLIQYYNGSSWQDSAQFTVGDGTITNIKLAANSVTSDKIAPGTVIAADIAAGTITATELADGAVTSGKILDGTIVNADINASAAIAHSKLASITAGQVLLGNASNIPTATALSGDVTVSSTGVTAISSGAIVNADVKSDAAIEQNKIADIIVDTKVASYVIANDLSDKNKIIEMNVGSANTVSVPTNANAPFPIGSQINITQYGTGKTQIVAVTPATTTIRATPGSYLRAQYSTATLIKRATDEWYLIGDLSAS